MLLTSRTTIGRAFGDYVDFYKKKFFYARK